MASTFRNNNNINSNFSMIELLKYLANNLKPEQLLHVAHIISRNPHLIDEETLIEIINEVDGYEMHKISDPIMDSYFKDDPEDEKCDDGPMEEMNKHFNRKNFEASKREHQEELKKLLNNNKIDLN